MTSSLCLLTLAHCKIDGVSFLSSYFFSLICRLPFLIIIADYEHSGLYSKRSINSVRQKEEVGELRSEFNECG